MKRSASLPTPAQRARALGVGSRHASQRASAEQAIRAMSAEAVPFLVEVVREEKEGAKRGARRVVYAWASAYAILFMLQLWLMRSGAWHDTGVTLQLTIVLTNALFFVAAIRHALIRRPTCHACAILAGMGDVRAVGPLVDAANGFETAEERAIAEALIELFPQLRASDAHLLDRGQYLKLLDELSEASDRAMLFPSLRIDFDTATIRALEQIGDEAAEKAVRKVAALHPYNRDCARLVAAAEAALPALEARASADRAGRTLLRAATSPGEQGGALLRPAGGSQTEGAEQLLRPVVTEDGEE